MFVVPFSVRASCEFVIAMTETVILIATGMSREHWYLKERDHVTCDSEETDFTTDSGPETDPYYSRLSTQLYEERGGYCRDSSLLELESVRTVRSPGTGTDSSLIQAIEISDICESRVTSCGRRRVCNWL